MTKTFATAVAVAAVLLSACNDDKVTTADAASKDPLIVQVGDDLAGRIRIDTVRTAPVSDTLRIAARVDFDEQRLTRIGASVTGRVTQIHAALGQMVAPGQVLAELNSAELSAAQLGFLKANAQADLLRRSLDRARLLFDNDVIGSAELQRRESEYEIALAESRAARDQLRVFGMSPQAIARLASQGTINSVTTVVASARGTVVERKIAQGEVVQPAAALFAVADLSRLWVVAQVPEQQISAVTAGQTVTMEVPALGNERFSGKLIYVGEIVSPETRTVVVRTEIDNADGKLKPAMLATMLIEDRPRERVTVPGAAVVRDGEADYVFVSLGDGRYRLSPVRLGPEVKGVRAVVAGLQGGETIVVDGAFHLNNERKRAEIEGA
jgi:cobalt-zinc-cadmium efflux system membrane fusion protein